MAPDRPVISKRAGRRARARKSRPAPDALAPAPARQARTRPRGAARPAKASERPQAPWHPLPLSELLILVGAIAVVIAFSSHPEKHFALLGVGLAAVAIGTFEVTLREHLGGFRSHTVLLAVIPPIALHSLVILALAGFIRVPRWVNFPLLALDLAVFALLYKYLRGRYLDARRVRALAGRR